MSGLDTRKHDPPIHQSRAFGGMASGKAFTCSNCAAIAAELTAQAVAVMAATAEKTRQESSLRLLHDAGQVVDSLVPSADPGVVFGHLAQAVLSVGVLRATVELIDRSSLVRLVHPAEDSVEPPTQPLIQTQQLFAGDGAPIISGNTLAVPIVATDSFAHLEPGPGSDFLGALLCEYPDPGPDSVAVELMTLLVRRAVSLVHQRRGEDALRLRIQNLELALTTNRQIGVAIGIVMSSRSVNAEQAFEQLRLVSQNRNTKLRDVAAEVTLAGALPETG